MTRAEETSQTLHSSQAPRACERGATRFRKIGASRGSLHSSSPLRRSILLTGICCALLIGCNSPQKDDRPSIEFTAIPEANDGGPDRVETIEGRVKGARPGQRIVLFARSGVWWVQPRRDEPFTTIQSDSTWKSLTHLGREYAAILVEPGYNPPATIETLPAEGGDVIARATTQGSSSSSEINKILNFSGYEWNVRNVSSERGGRKNEYDPTNVWTDEDGFLHLRIARKSDNWTCAEMRLTRSLGYGSYLMVVREVSHLEPSMVLSMFTWDQAASEENHRELGVEITRWGDPAGKNAQYTIQPYYVPANVARFTAPSGVLTYSFRWEPGKVAFKTVRGSGLGSSPVIAEHVFTSGIPSSGNELLHLNLYIFGNTVIPLQNETEVVIEKFEYLP